MLTNSTRARRLLATVATGMTLAAAATGAALTRRPRRRPRRASTTSECSPKCTRTPARARRS